MSYTPGATGLDLVERRPQVADESWLELPQASRLMGGPSLMKTLARMTVEEFREVVEEAVERKLTELLSDPDKGRSLRATVERRLRRSLQASRRGERGIPAGEVAKRYGLKW